MTTVVIWLAAALGASALAGVVALWLRLSTLRPIEADEFAALLAKARVEFAVLADQCEMMIEEARHQRRAAAGARGGSSKKEPEAEAPKFASVAAYRRHLERGGARDLEAERQLGVGTH